MINRLDVNRCDTLCLLQRTFELRSAENRAAADPRADAFLFRNRFFEIPRVADFNNLHSLHEQHWGHCAILSECCGEFQ
jgi:hypothetical protein